MVNGKKSFEIKPLVRKESETTLFEKGFSLEDEGEELFSNSLGKYKSLYIVDYFTVPLST